MTEQAVAELRREATVLARIVCAQGAAPEVVAEGEIRLDEIRGELKRAGANLGASRERRRVLGLLSACRERNSESLFLDFVRDGSGIEEAAAFIAVAAGTEAADLKRLGGQP